MTDAEIQRLAALAREATPGERKFEPHPYGYGYSVLWVPETRTEILVTGGRNDGDDPITWMGEELTDADREFIEAANPAAVLALIERVRELEADAARFRWLIKGAGSHYATGEDWYLSAIQWTSQNRRETMRDAIDQAMEWDK